MKMRFALLLFIVGSAMGAQDMGAQDFGFELINKTKATAYIDLENAGELIAKNLPVGPGDTSAPWVIIAKEPTKLSISYVGDKGAEVEKSYTFTPGKTIYVTLDEKGLRPQTGPLRGLTGRTETGFSLKNNVGKRDIKKSNKK